MTKLQAKHEEHRNSRGAVEVGKNKQEKANIEGYICVLMKSNTKRCPKWSGVLGVAVRQTKESRKNFSGRLRHATCDQLQ